MTAEGFEDGDVSENIAEDDNRVVKGHLSVNTSDHQSVERSRNSGGVSG